MKTKGILDSQELDSDKMTDVESEIFEKQHELCLLCKKYDIPFFGVMFGTNPIFSQHFGIPEQTNKEELGKRLVKFLEILNAQVLRLSLGSYSISPVNQNKKVIEPEEDDYNEGEDRNAGESWKNE